MLEQYWVVKQEPASYSWDDFVHDGQTTWSGVRNYQARNHLRSMRIGDKVCFYHSVTEKQIVGIAKVVLDAFSDPTADEGDWSAVKLAPLIALRNSVTLEQIKNDPLLKLIPLVRNSRLSVTPLSAKEFARVLQFADTRLE